MTDKIFCAIDTADLNTAKNLISQIAPHISGLKFGLEFFNAHGPAGVQAVCPDGAELFLDLKYHDIPNTVAGAIRAVAPVKPKFLNVHASGGPAMMKAAKQAALETMGQATKLLGVTVLTSLGADDLEAVGQHAQVSEQVVRLARLAQDSGLDGVVCSAFEIEAIRAECGPDFILMVPGIRPRTSDPADQRRIKTPEDALSAGANHLVIGRPITEALDPAAAAQAIAASLEKIAA